MKEENLQIIVFFIWFFLFIMGELDFFSCLIEKRMKSVRRSNKYQVTIPKPIDYISENRPITLTFDEIEFWEETEEGYWIEYCVVPWRIYYDTVEDTIVLRTSNNNKRYIPCQSLNLERNHGYFSYS